MNSNLLSRYIFGLLIEIIICISTKCDGSKPHIIFILADDLGWNDVGFHGSNQIPTPNIDVLAYSGLTLHNYYVTPICTPSRSSLMTGKYPIHTGMQHGVLKGAEPRGLPLSEKLLPQYLKEHGYRTHLVGKWHLGSFKKVYTPLYRGFDSHLGFWTGRIDYYDHTSMEMGSWGFDFRRNMEVEYNLFGQYATDIYSDESVKLIQQHNTSLPMFLMVAHSAVHSGNPNSPLRAPDYLIDMFADIENANRSRFAAMMTKLDESVGRVVEALHQRDMLRDSIFIFSTDNGGPAGGFNFNAASNFPLKGVKNTPWEGGVRGAGLLWAGERIKPRVAKQRIHISDWLPTLLSAIGNNSKICNIDGQNIWSSLINDTPSPRHTVLHNIDDITGYASLTSYQWKINKGTTYNGEFDSWYGPDGRTGEYNIEKLFNCPAGKALKELKLLPNQERILQIRNQATISCLNATEIRCNPIEKPCLFNIYEDPCERVDLAESKSGILKQMLQLIDDFNKTALPPSNVPADPRGDPKYWNHVYTNFGDHSS